jgi:hypothetical protein
MSSPAAGKGKGSPGAGRGRARRSLYSRALDEAEALEFELAQGVEGIDDEIALLRLKIRSLLERDPENLKLIMEATTTLARLVTVRYRISADQKKALTSAIGSVLRDLALPLGIKYMPW